MIFMRKLYLLLIILFLSAPIVGAQKSDNNHYLVIKKSFVDKKKSYKLTMRLEYRHIIAAGLIGVCATVGLAYGSYTLYSYYPAILDALRAYQTIQRHPWIITTVKKIRDTNTYLNSFVLQKALLAKMFFAAVSKKMHITKAFSKRVITSLGHCFPTLNPVEFFELDATRGLL